jgi:hypothetical protein
MNGQAAQAVRRSVGENSLFMAVKDIPIRYKNKCEKENKSFCKNESQLSRARLVVMRCR